MLKAALTTMTKLSDELDALKVEKKALVQTQGEAQLRLERAKVAYNNAINSKNELYSKVHHLATPQSCGSTIVPYSTMCACMACKKHVATMCLQCIEHVSIQSLGRTGPLQTSPQLIIIQLGVRVVQCIYHACI